MPHSTSPAIPFPESGGLSKKVKIIVTRHVPVLSGTLMIIYILETIVIYGD